MNGFPDKMTDHQVLTNTTNIPINMGLQAHPCSNKRTIEGLEEPAGRSNYNQQQQQQQQQQHNNLGPRAAKQQCTIRVGVEAPDHLVASETSVPNNNWYHRDAVQQQPTTTTPDYETYVNGFNAAQVRASTPYSVSSSTNSSSYYSATAENLPVPAVEYSYNTTTTTTTVSNNNSAETGYSTSQNVYQNLTSMLPVTNGGGESLADRFERVCSSPRPYVQYNNVAPTREEPAAGYHYGNNETARSDDRYWTFGYTSHCPKKSSPGYAKSNNYGYPDNNGFGHKVGYQQHHQQQLATTGQQTIQRDENGKSYLELGAKAAVQPEWVRPWPAQQQQQQQQQHHQQHYVSSAPAVVKSCSKCGHVLLNNSSRSLAQQPCYRHQRLSVLSLSMLKLNRYRQCSDPSLHRSVLICNTLRHIEDEMEREGLVCNPSAEVATNNCDTCCCSHCGTVFNNSSTPTAKSDTSPAAYNNNNNNNNTTTSSSSNSTSNVSSNMNNNNAAVYDSTPDPNFANNSNNNSSSTSSSTSTTISTSTSNNNNNSTSSSSDYNSSAAKTTTSVANADEDDSGFGDEDSRDIDWSSVFSMSTTSGFEVSGGSNSNGSSSDSYLCDSNSSDPSLFAGPGAELVNDLGPNWKSSHCGSSSSSGGSSSSWTSDASDFSGVRWKSELGDELEGFVHILVGS